MEGSETVKLKSHLEKSFVAREVCNFVVFQDGITLCTPGCRGTRATTT